MGRTYTFNNIAYPSVTTVLDELNKGDGIIQWAVNSALDCVKNDADLRHIIENDSEINCGVLEEMLGNIMNEAKFQWKKNKDEAAGWGTEAHDLIEQYIKDGRDVKDQRAPEVENAFLAFLEWEKENKIKWLESEKNVFSASLGTAGTVDAIAKFGAGDLKGRIFMIDFKTSKDFYPTFGLQANMYRFARTECNGLTGVDLVGPFGNYKIDYPKVKMDGTGILRIDKFTGMPDFKDYSEKYRRDVAIFQVLIQLYYLLKDRRLKNNPFALAVKEFYGK